MDQIQQVRSKIDIVDLIGSYINLKKAGSNFKALCPFHSEKTPSFVVSPERQIFKCFGCGKGGDVFGFLMEYENMTFAESLRFLAKKAGVKLTSFKPSSQQQAKDRLLEINHLASEYYHYILLNHKVGKKGLNYFLKRGISKTSINLFKLGYAPNDWEGLYNFLVRKKGYEPEELKKAGLIIKGRGWYDRFRGRIMFPLKDHRGNVLGFSGRVLEKDLKGAKYINTPETAIYHKSELLYGLEQTKNFVKKEEKAVVVEGEFDVISSYQAGVKNVAAIKGSALTQEQVNLLKRFTQTLVLALDADMAGDQAVRKGIETAERADLIVRITQPIYGKDPDECARHSGKMWRDSVKKAVMVYDFYIQSGKKRFDVKTAEGKKKLTQELLPIFSSISNQVIKAHYFKKLAKLLDISEETLLQEADRLAKMKKSPTSLFAKKDDKKQTKASRQELVEEFLLSLILQSSKKIKFLKQLDFKIFSQPAVKKILKNLLDFLKSQKAKNKKKKQTGKKQVKTKKTKFSINKFACSLPEELVEQVDRAYLRQLPQELKDEDMLAREFKKLSLEIEKNYLQTKLHKLRQDMKQKEKEKKTKELKKLQKEFVNLTKRLNQQVS
jgi:DNA primase